MGLRRASEIMREEVAALVLLSGDSDESTVALASQLLAATIAEALTEAFELGNGRRVLLN